MAITPADIENMTFSQAGKHEEGYKTDEVDVFLDQVASEVDAMLQKIADLKGRLTTSEQQLAAAQAQVAQLKEQTAMAAPVEPAPCARAAVRVHRLRAPDLPGAHRCPAER
jgi:cell division initiation protein